MHRCWNGRQASFRNWCPTGMRVRVPLCAPYTFLAQLVEQRSFKPQVAGSSPAGRTTCVLSSVGNHRFALPGAGEAKRGFPQRSKNARISESPKHFSGTARRKSDGLLIRMPQVQVLQDAPQRQKKPAPFRFHGLRKCRENSIFAVSFFLFQTGPASLGSGLGQMRNIFKTNKCVFSSAGRAADS